MATTLAARVARGQAAMARTTTRRGVSAAQRAFGDRNAGWGSGCHGNGIGGNGRSGGNGGSGWGAPDDGHQGSSQFLGRALLGGLFLTAAMTVGGMAVPAPSHAAPPPGFFSRGGSPLNDSPLLSSSAPTHSGRGGFADMLERSSVGSGSTAGFGLSRRSSATGSASASAAAASEAGASSPARPRSKVLHVACKGSTLVVPLPTGGDADKAAAATGSLPAAPALPLWQRRRVVDAPIQLSEREARMMASRQNRVRDSLFVQ